MRTVKFKAGDPIINEGDAGETAFYIVDGSVEVSIGLGKKERTVGALKAGEIFGEMSLIVPGPRSATVRAVTDVECLETSYDEFISAVKKNPDQAVEFMKTSGAAASADERDDGKSGSAPARAPRTRARSRQVARAAGARRGESRPFLAHDLVSAGGSGPRSTRAAGPSP